MSHQVENPMDEFSLPKLAKSRMLYDRIPGSNIENLVFAAIRSLVVKAHSIEIPGDYVKVLIVDHAELSQIALMDELLIYEVEENDGNARFKKNYSIDPGKKVAYINISKVTG